MTPLVRLKHAGSQTLAAARFFCRTIMDFVYPPLCLLCNRSLNNDERLVHAKCLAGLPLLDQEDLSEDPLTTALRFVPYFERSLALYPYSDQLQQLVHYFKYRGFRSLAEPLGRNLGHLIVDLGYSNQIDMLVPVPLHKNRLRERGYNQAELLAESMSDVCRIPVYAGVLVRNRSTPPQAQIKRAQRMRNLRDAFVVTDVGKVVDKTVALVDDVLTTGHTLNECSRMLSQAGAARVIAITVARVV